MMAKRGGRWCGRMNTPNASHASLHLQRWAERLSYAVVPSVLEVRKSNTSSSDLTMANELRQCDLCGSTENVRDYALTIDGVSLETASRLCQAHGENLLWRCSIVIGSLRQPIGDVFIRRTRNHEPSQQDPKG